MSRRLLALLLILIVGLLFVLNAGCSSDDDPVTPVTTGKIVIDVEPNDLGVSWTLVGPNKVDVEGTGDKTLSEQAPGEYTVIWGSVDGYLTPFSDQQALAADGTITFNGVYSEEPVLVPGYVLIPPSSVSMPATFTMGSTVEINPEEGIAETPHQVTLTGSFKMASTEITNGQYMAALQWAYDQGHVTATTTTVLDNLDGSTVELLDLDGDFLGHGFQITFSGSVFSTSNPDRPVVFVSWYGAVAYCDWLSMQDSLPRAYDHSNWSCNSGNPYTASGFRLPTEAEWEFACRAGTMTHFNTGDCLDAGTEANYNGGAPYTDCPSGPYFGSTSDVGSYPSNLWGLFDMHGNIYEWCNDWSGTYSGDETDPEGVGSGYSRVRRGGSWGAYARFCRSANRQSNNPTRSFHNCGFRPVRSVQ